MKKANLAIRPVPPGEILLEEFLKPMGISQNMLAREIDVSPRRVNEIVLGRRSITADTALRLGRYFDMEPEFWMNLQSRYDLRTAKNKLGKNLKKRVRRRAITPA
ncbi:MAG: HigA family addiction module antitoxin [Nitrospinota bacterium]